MTSKRVGGVAGALAGVLWLFTTAAYDAGPDDATATSEQIRAFVEGNASAARLGTVAAGLVAVLLLSFLATVRRSLRDADAEPLADIAYAAGIVVCVFVVAAAAAAAVPIVRQLSRADPEYIRTWYGLRALGNLFVFATFPQGVFVGAASLAAVTRHAFARGAGWLGLATAAAAFVGGFRFLGDPSGALYSTLDVSAIASHFLMALWLFVTGLALAFRRERAA